jgi:hypothetical protein
MTDSTWGTRPRAEHELDAAFMRQNLQRSNDWAIALCILATVDLAAEPGAMSLIEDVVTLRAGRATEDELQEWGQRTRSFLYRLLQADEPVAPRPLN